MTQLKQRLRRNLLRLVWRNTQVAVMLILNHVQLQLVKHHLWVLWTDYFKPNHFEAYPQLHTLFNEATKLAGAGGSKGTNDIAVADKLIKKIDEISEIFWATKK
jgi:nickel superoxide dismutase